MIPGLGMLVGPIVDGVMSIVGSKDKKRELHAAVSQAILQHSTDIVKAQAGVITAEIQGRSWMQRNWRPILMLSIVAILVNNYILLPYAQAFGLPIQLLDLPPSLLGLMTIGVGGYIGGRTYEKTKGLGVQQAALRSPSEPT